MAIEIGIVNADTSVKIGATTVQSGYIGNNIFFGNEVPILDSFPNAYHAHSLRKLRTAYTGFCLRVRRTAVTSTEVNVGFDSNNTISLNSPIVYASGTATNATTLGQFAQGIVDGLIAHSNIFVVTWYDQSGNGRNPTQGTAGQQPRIVRLASGVATLETNTSGGKVAVRFIQANNTFLGISNTSIPLNNVSSYTLGTAISTTSANTLLTLGYTAGNIFHLPQNLGITYLSTGAFSGNGVVVGQNRLYSLICGASTTSAYANGNILTPATVTSGAGPNTFIRFGHRGITVVYSDIYMQEAISFVGNPSKIALETNINKYYKIW
jgi:hypothetical protein